MGMNSPVQQRAVTGALGALNATLGLGATIANRFDVVASGTFAGTIAVQRQFNGVWYTVDTLTAAGAKTYAYAVAAPVQLVMSAFTSGSAACVLAGVEAY